MNKFEPWEEDFVDAVQSFWKRSDNDQREFDPDGAEQQLHNLSAGVDIRVGELLDANTPDLCLSMGKSTVKVSLQMYAILVNLAVLGFKRMEEVEEDREKFEDTFGNLNLPEF